MAKTNKNLVFCEGAAKVMQGITLNDKEELIKALEKLYKTFEISGLSNTILKEKSEDYLRIKIYENGYSKNIEAVSEFNSTRFKYHTISDWFLIRYYNFVGLRLYEYKIPIALINKA